MRPRVMWNLSLTTLAAGARQLVVQEALEITSCLAGSYLSSFTPMTIVISSPSAGAEMMTFFAPPRVMWLIAPWTVLPFLLTPSFFTVKRPVDSITIETPRSPHGILPGSVSVSYTHLRAHETRHDLVC